VKSPAYAGTDLFVARNGRIASAKMRNLGEAECFVKAVELKSPTQQQKI
jgi:hypothetical protein